MYARLALPLGQNHGRHRAPADGNANLTEEGLPRTPSPLSPRATELLLLLNRLFLDSSGRNVPFEPSPVVSISHSTAKRVSLRGTQNLLLYLCTARSLSEADKIVSNGYRRFKQVC